MKNICFIASECVPFIKTGGLADVVGSLPKYFDKEKYDVRVIIPNYTCIAEKFRNTMQYHSHFYMNYNGRDRHVGIMELDYDGIHYYFVDNEDYFSGPKPYTDMFFDLEKFAFFSKAALSILPVVGFRPDKLEHFKNGNMLKGGIVYSDYVTTVSDTYAREIQTPFYGENLDGLMRARSGQLWGIVNGIDYEVYNPATDDLIAKKYSVDTFRRDKVKNKLALQKELGLKEDPKCMMIGIVSRLTDQKGFDLIQCVMDELCGDAIQLVVLGTGDAKYENMFRHYDWKYSDSVSAMIAYNDAMSHKIYASCDAFLMPSLFEPCGLSQLMSLRYGTAPIVRETGGLKDTVEPYNEYEKTGTGFSFMNYNAHEMLHTIRYAEQVYYDKKRDWNRIVERAMQADFSWGASAQKYEELYSRMLQ